MGDEGRPLAAALQGEAANHRKVRRSRAVRAERCGKGELPARQVGARKASESDPLMKCRKHRPGDIETGGTSLSRDKPGGYLLTGQAVSGTQVARAWLRRPFGTREPAAPKTWPRRGRGCPWSREGDPQAAEPRGAEYRWRSTGTDRCVVAMKAP